MTFDEACDLAKAIEGTQSFMVVAIGHFQPEPSKSMPWGISIICRLDSVKSVLWTEDDWRRIASSSSPARKPETESKAETVAARREPSGSSPQLQLF